MSYGVFIDSRAQREVDQLPAAVRRQVIRRIEALAQDPAPAASEPLHGRQFKSLRKLRSGDYRIIYTINWGRLIVLVVAVGNRRDVYERLARQWRGR